VSPHGAASRFGQSFDIFGQLSHTGAEVCKTWVVSAIDAAVTASTATAEPAATWSPNQQAARRRIIEAAADLVADQGLSACTIRAVAERSGLTKSTVHYYFDDANELVDLSVSEIMERMARHGRESVLAAGEGAGGMEFLVRLFMGRGRTPPQVGFRESMLWPAYTAHAWQRGARANILHGLDTIRAVFELALEQAAVPQEKVAERADAAHNYLLGAMIRNMIEPMPSAAVARAVSALTGVALDPTHC
jgi:AcrR family transcriptional regulator